MNKLLYKATLLFILLIGVIGYDTVYIPVVVLLISVMLSALVQSFYEKKLSVVFVLLQVVLMFLHPAFCFSAPLLLFDLLYIKKSWIGLAVPIAIFTQYESFSVTHIMLIIFGCIVSLLFWRSSFLLEKAENTLIEMRDSSRETTIGLQEKNRRLIEEQDNEINLATMKERNRIAREIHDNVGHMLTRSILQVGALNVINKDENLKEPLIELKDTLNNAMTSIRNSVHDLHDDSINLKSVLSESLKPLSEQFTTDYVFDFSETMPKNIKLCFIGVIKECVSNAVKHSTGDSIDITIREHPGFYHFSFADNGKCDGKINESGIGLSNIRERASSVNGYVNIESTEKGFKIFLSVPRKD